MPSDRVERRLAAILAADVAGYSRLMGADEQRTVAGLRSLRSGVTDPRIAEHHGRIVNTAGDSILAEFGSVLDAVRCAVEIQQGIASGNPNVPEDQRIVFRIGINLGDVIFEGAEVYGDGVNIAARLEGICDPGGICIGANVYDQVHDKLPYAWEDRGKQHLKNIVDPVRAYRWKPGAVAARRPGHPRRWRVPFVAAAVALGLAAAGWAGWRFLPGFGAPKRPSLSIVVLPFDNLSRDPAQDYFVDGLTEDLITDLSRIAGAFVIARNTSFTYKGKAVDVKEVAREVNVRYVLEGSVQRQGRAVRVTVQLIDGETGAHMWAERFDRTLENVFAVQNEIVGRLAVVLGVELVRAEGRRVQQGAAGSLDSHDLMLRARAAGSRQARTPEVQREVMTLAQKAIALDPSNVQAWVEVSRVHHWDALLGFSPSRLESLRLAQEAAERARDLDPQSAPAHERLADAYTHLGKQEQAISEAEKCVTLDRNLLNCYNIMALSLIYLGRSEAAFSPNAKAMELSPRDPYGPAFYVVGSLAHLHLGHDAEAMALARQGITIDDKYPFNYFVLAAALGNRGELVQARETWSKFKTFPTSETLDTIAKWRTRDLSRSKNPTFLAQREKYLYPGLRKAGVPEE